MLPPFLFIVLRVLHLLVKDNYLKIINGQVSLNIEFSHLIRGVTIAWVCKFYHVVISKPLSKPVSKPKNTWKHIIKGNKRWIVRHFDERTLVAI